MFCYFVILIYFRYHLFGVTQKLSNKDHFVGYLHLNEHWYIFDGMQSYQVRQVSYDAIKHESSLEHLIVYHDETLESSDESIVY